MNNIIRSLPDRATISRKIFNVLVQMGAFAVILEPMWMVLPFAGFLYGSVLPVESASENLRTAWLVHFILVLQSPVAYQKNHFQEFRSQWKLYKVVRAFNMSFGRLEAGQDPVEGDVRVLGPPWGMAQPFFQARMNERVHFFLSGL